MFKYRSKVAFASALIATLYVIYICTYFSDASTDAAGAVAFILVMPHIAANVIAIIFNWVGFLANAKWAIIVALVLYCIAMLLFFPYFMFDVPSVILSAVAIGKVSKINKAKNNQ